MNYIAAFHGFKFFNRITLDGAPISEALDVFRQVFLSLVAPRLELFNSSVSRRALAKCSRLS